MTQYEIVSKRIECVRLALQVPANQKEYLAASFGGQPQLPHAKSTAEILKDAEAIFEWITKQQTI